MSDLYTPRPFTARKSNRVSHKNEHALYKKMDVSPEILDTTPVCDIVFCFDTTGSMSSILSSLRSHLSETVERLFREISGLRIGIIGHGDYCDVSANRYLAHICPLTSDIESIKKAIKEFPSTGGGDAPEAYEYMLHLSHTVFDWKSVVKVFVVIADEIPHEPGYELPYNCLYYPEVGRGNQNERLHINWREEADICKEKGLVVFSCHALANSNKHAVPFYTHIADTTGGYYFVLDDLQSFYHYMNTICFKAADAAEDLEIMKEKKEKLLEELKQVEEQVRERKSRGEKVEKLEALRTNLTSAFCDLDSVEKDVQTFGLFKSSAIRQYSNTVREKEGVDSEEENTLSSGKSFRKTKRAAKYASETESHHKNLSSASINFLNMMKEDK